ncbi:hypothetical protein LCGC14_2903470 [marine sediment metagenome]|uniref:Uncharacterized protein n=1 Tax=marine sediment metagenome TaxID=412755 RepID=A0A0F9A1I8_9ZZZZ
MPEYAAVNITDIDIIFEWTTALSNYTAEMKFYLISSGSSTVTTVAAVISTQTSIQTFATYTNPADTTNFNGEGTWRIWSEVTSSTGRFRACEPILMDFRIIGQS